MPKTSKKAKKEKGHDNIQDLIESLQSKFGEGAIMKMGDKKIAKVETVPTGSYSLDIALGVGGIPKGRIVEVYGPEMSGKTTMALSIIAQSQKKGGKCAFIDAEHAMDPEYAKHIGVDIKELLISQPDSGEDALNMVENLARSELIDVIVVDSVAALTPQAELDGEIGDQQIGLQARLMSQALRKLAALASKSNTMIIFINQIRSKIGVMWGSPDTTPGGRALKFYSSVRLDVRRIAQIKKGEEVIGNRVKVKVSKNKVAPPFRVAEFDLLYGKGISYEHDVLNTAIKHKVVTRSGNTYSVGDEKLGVGLDAAAATLKEQKKLLTEIKKDIETILKKKEEE
jgi:recombination protein RecA